MEIIGYDLDGYEPLTHTILDLINEYPFGKNDITFQILGDKSGKAMFPSPNSAIISEQRDVTGHITQRCSYTFNVVYRNYNTAEYKKIDVKEWLDNLGKWLEKQVVTDGTTAYKLDNYPDIGEGREITSISRATQSYLYNITDDKAEDWSITIQVSYTNEYDI